MIHRDGLVVALFALFAFLLCRQALSGEASFLFHDLEHHHVPWRAWAARTLLSGELPLWAPVGHGYPLFADGQASIGYPPTWVLFGLLSPGAALGWTVWLHLVAGAAGGWALARVLGRSPSASLFAGFAYGFGGFAISHIVYLGMFQVLALLPGWIAVALIATRRGGRWWVGTGIMGALIWLAGHAQMALYASYILGFLVVWDAVELRSTLRWRPLVGLVVAAGIAGLIAAPQLLATWELTAFTGRAGGVEAAFAAMGGLPPEELLHAIVPTVFGFEPPSAIDITYHHRSGGYVGRGVSYWEDTFYLGIPVFFLAVAAGWLRSARRWWVLVGFGLFFAFGAANPLYEAVRWLPGMGWFRFPVRGLVLVAVAAPQLAALGCDRMGLWLRARPERVARSILGLSVALLVVVLTLTALRFALSGVWAPLESALLERLPEDPARARGLVAAARNLVTPWSSVLAGQLGLAAALLVVFWGAARAHLSPLGAMRLTTVLLVLDLGLFDRGFLETRSTRELIEMPAVVSEQIGGPAGSRFTVFDRRVPVAVGRAAVSANLPLLWGLEDVIVPSPLRIVRNDRYLERVGLGLGLEPSDEQLRALESGRALLDHSGVRFLATAGDLDGLGLVRRGRTGAVALYENEGALPRVHAVGCTRQVESDDALEQLVAGAARRGTAFVEGAAGLATCEPGITLPERLEPVGNGGWQATLRTDGPAWVVFSETWFPGWTVWVDGEARTPVRTNYLFQGVEVGPGEHTVIFRYQPRYIVWTALAWLMALVLGLATSFAWRRYR